MVTMNKPSANATNWYQPLTDNWTAIQSSLLDKSTVSAKGDILVATGASSLSRLPVGGNRQLLTADSTQSTGVKWASGTTDMAESLLLKSFFSAQSLLPSNVIKESLYSWPPIDFSNLEFGTFAQVGSRVKFTPSGPTANFGWSLGGTYSKVLMILGGVRPRNYSASIFICNTLPVVGDLSDGYSFTNEPSNSAMKIYKANGGGSYTQLASEIYVFTSVGYDVHSCALAAYVDGTANRLVMCSRMGPEVWMTLHDITDTTLTTFKYAGISISNEYGDVHWMVSPLAIYAQ